MYRVIVVPVDGSVFSEGALPLATSLARLTGARLDLVQVIEPPAIDGAAPWLGDLETRAAEYVGLLAEALRAAGAPEVVTHVLDGPVAKRIKSHVEDAGGDLVVMATHGRGALTRSWLGSVADRLVRTSPVPVLLIRPTESDHPSFQRARDIRHILVPIDGSAESESVVDPVSELAIPLAAEITLLRVIEDPLPPGLVFLPGGLQDSDELVDEAVKEARAHLADLAGHVERRGVAVRVELLVDESPASAILKHADEAPVDLIAMSTHGRGGLERVVLGSVADKVVRASKTPVLVFTRAAVAVG
jgi:nucleotide-binding universal stress UspA family protein